MRQKRLEIGLTYHIYNRGNNRSRIFLDDYNYLYFLGLWKKYLLQVTDIIAYCLLPNHFHLVLQIREVDLDLNQLSQNKVNTIFATCFGTYTKAFNKRYSRTGSLFEGRFNRKTINDDDQLINTIVYIHFNPQIHGYLDDYAYWQFSSYNGYKHKSPGDILAPWIFKDKDLYDSIMSAHQNKQDVVPILEKR